MEDFKFMDIDGKKISLLNNVTADKLVYIAIAILISIPVWNVRMEKLNS